MNLTILKTEATIAFNYPTLAGDTGERVRIRQDKLDTGKWRLMAVSEKDGSAIEGIEPVLISAVDKLKAQSTNQTTEFMNLANFFGVIQ